MDKVQTMEAVAAHNLVPEQLLERERQRHEETLLRKQNSNLLAEEHPDFIAQKFSELAADIKAAINESVKQFLHKAAAEEIATQDECDSPQQKFAGHAARISELQRYLTACTRFLPDYKIKACTQIISELNKSLDESRQQVMPKKKFGFSARKAAKKPKVVDSNDEKEKCDPSKPIGNVLNSKAEPPVVSLNSTNMSLNRKHMDRQAEYILESGDDINSHDVTLVNLKNCFVDLRGHASSVRFDNLSDCVVLIGPVSSSVYVENCTNCTFAIACQQLRCHNSNSCRICLHVTCRAVMEDCHDMHFGNYKHSYDGIELDFQAAGLDESINNYADIADFNWLSPHVPSPNWCLMKTDESIDFDSLRRDFEAKSSNASSVVGKQT